MADSTGDQSAGECSDLQKQFLIAFREHANVAVKVDSLIIRVDKLEKIHVEFEEKHTEFMEKLQPVHDAYLKGMTLKSKAGTAAIVYVIAMLLFPQLSPSSIVSVIKLLI